MSTNKIKILFVDDEADIVRVIKAGLEHSGFLVDAFTSPQEALDHFKEDYYDDILLDIKMPLMNGFELSRKIWQIDNNAKICFFSAFDIYEDEARKVFTNLHHFCFITKPITIANLIVHVKKHLSQH